jgi:hypothetical protein
MLQKQLRTMANSKKTPPQSPKSDRLNTEPGGEQQRVRRDREDTGVGRGTRNKAKNQGRHGDRGKGHSGGR